MRKFPVIEHIENRFVFGEFIDSTGTQQATVGLLHVIIQLVFSSDSLCLSDLIELLLKWFGFY